MLAVLDFIATHTGIFALTVLAVYAAAVLLDDQRSHPEPTVDVASVKALTDKVVVSSGDDASGTARAQT